MNIFRKKVQKGFTLVEMMVSIFIFLIVMTAIVQIFVQQIHVYQRAQNMQEDMENAQFTMNYLAKTLRTSTVLGEVTGGSVGWDRNNFIDQDGTNHETGQEGNDFHGALITNVNQSLVIYDFSQDRCLKLTFYGKGTSPDGYSGGALIMERSAADFTVDPAHFVNFNEIDRCLDNDVYVEQRRLTTGNVDGSFFASPTRFKDNFATNERLTDAIGRVTIAMKILPKNLDENDMEPVYMQTTTSLRDYPSDLSF
ncbi:MAG: hypothetical protein CR972_00815 [Candidatus Moraniibacteriota bacterium]|nr:MAG: hypothetical protein CR972_00815 [Candidatus Moranbacteria bacterium]